MGIDAFATPRRYSMEFLRPRDMFLQVLLVVPVPIVGALAGLPSRLGPEIVFAWIALVLALQVANASRRMAVATPVFQLPPNP